MMTAIEVGTAMMKAKVRIMDDSEYRSMAGLLFAKQDIPVNFEEAPPVFQIISKRLEWAKVPAENRVILMAAILCPSPGIAALYCAAIKAISAQRDGAKVTLDDFINGFPMGFPVNEDLHKIWDSQKVFDGGQGDNWLDREEAWR